MVNHERTKKNRRNKFSYKHILEWLVFVTSDGPWKPKEEITCLLFLWCYIPSFSRKWNLFCIEGAYSRKKSKILNKMYCTCWTNMFTCNYPGSCECLYGWLNPERKNVENNKAHWLKEKEFPTNNNGYVKSALTLIRKTEKTLK